MIGTLLAVALLPVTLEQEPAPVPQARDSTRSEAVRVYLDCNACDFDYLRTEITFVNWVRDRMDAEVIVLVTTLPTGSGGREFTLTFFGRHRFQGRDDTLAFSVGGTDTPVERRQELARNIGFGLIRFAARSPLARHVEIRYAPPQAAAPAREGRDRWHHWLFNLNGNGFLSGLSLSSDRFVSANVSANHVADDWKITLSSGANYSRSSFELDSVTTFVTRRESYNVFAQAVRSRGPRWSLGASVSALRSTYTNVDVRIRVTPAVEFDLYPYAEATRRQLVFRYAAGVEYSDYHSTTIYGRTSESRPVHIITAGYAVRQPWGSVGAAVNFSQYLHDLSKQNVRFSGGPNLRLFRGLMLNVSGSYTIVRDQLYLSATALTPEQIVARQQALATDYSYNVSLGLSYRFGSIYNNVVNPRFQIGSGFIE